MFPRSLAVLALTVAGGVTAFADFSYSTTTKTTGGSMSGMMGAVADRAGKVYLKGEKMMTVTGGNATIIDFGAQTITTIDNTQKTYTVKKFSDIAAGEAGTKMDVSVDVKETGNKKTINGFNASEMVFTMNVEMDMGRGAPLKMRMESHMWVSSDVSGTGELRAFYKKNAANFPWAAMTGSGGNQSMQKAMAQMQRKMAEMDGMPVEQVVRILPAAGAAAPQAPQAPQMTAEQQAQLKEAMAQAQQMQQQGGQDAQTGAAMQKALAAMGAMGRGGAPNAASNSAGGATIEMTIDSTGFSSASVPDSVFAIPAGYKAK